MAEAFVKTFKRDYVRVNPIPDARTALMRLDGGLQLRTPAFPVGLPLTAGVHCIHQTSRVSGLTESTPRSRLPEKQIIGI